MDFGELFRTHKMWFIIGGAAVAGLVLYSFIKNKSSSSSSIGPSTVTPGTTNPSQYLVPYNAYFNGSQPDGGSTGASMQTNASASTTGGPSSAVPTNAATGGAPVTPAAATSSAVATGAGPSYLEVTQAAALQDISKGIPVFEQGSSAIAFASKYGGSPAGIDPNSYYQQNPTAAQINLASSLGYPLYVKAAA